jgi:hypothetical protein
MRLMSMSIVSTLVACVGFGVTLYGADLTETFDAGFDAWVIVDEAGANTSPSAWDTVAEVAGHTAVFAPLSNIYAGDAGATEPSRGTWAYYQGGDWEIADFQADMHFTDNDVPGLAFRWADENNHYIFDLGEQERTGLLGFKRLRKVVGGTYTLLDVVEDGGYAQNVWYTARIEYSSSNIKVFWDDVLIFDVADSEPGLPGGTVALTSWGMTDVFFDNISVVNRSVAVEPAGKLAHVWATIKAAR